MIIMIVSLHKEVVDFSVFSTNMCGISASPINSI